MRHSRSDLAARSVDATAWDEVTCGKNVTANWRLISRPGSAVLKSSDGRDGVVLVSSAWRQVGAGAYWSYAVSKSGWLAGRLGRHLFGANRDHQRARSTSCHAGDRFRTRCAHRALPAEDPRDARNPRRRRERLVDLCLRALAGTAASSKPNPQGQVSLPSAPFLTDQER